MPTILELFENSTLDTSVKADKDTLVEQELTGIRVKSLVELNNPLIYGNEALRIANRTTSTLDKMEAGRGTEGGSNGLIGAGLSAATLGQVNSLSEARDFANNFLGIPTKQIPTTVVERIKNDPNHDTSIPVQSVGDGTEIGKILKDVGGNPQTIAKQAIGRGIGFAKDKVRQKLYGNNPEVKDADGNERGFIQQYTNKSTKSNSQTRTLENYRGISNDLDVINLITTSDTAKLQTATGEFEYDGKKYKDLIPFYIGKALDDVYTMFRANITGLTESVSPSWNTHKFLGNPFNFYTYSGVERSVSFTLQIYAGSKLELATNWEKISQLTAMTYPTINSAKLVNPPIIKFRLGDIYFHAYGFIESLSYTMPDAGVWETEEDGSLLPKFIDAAITIKLIEDTSVLNGIYGYKKSKAAIDSINKSNQSSNVSGNPQTGRQQEIPIKVNQRGLPTFDPTKDLKPITNIETPGSKGSIKNKIKSLIDRLKRNKSEVTPEQNQTGTQSTNVAQSALAVDKLNSKTAASGLSGEKL